VEAGLHRAAFAPVGQADLKVTVTLDHRDPDEWHAGIDLGDVSERVLGHREITSKGETCSAINEPLALAVSLMVDVSRESIGLPPAKAEPVQMSAEAAPAWYGALFLLGSARVGQPPGLGRGVTLAGELGRGIWAAGLSATAWVPAQTTTGSFGARFSLLSVQADICPRVASWQRVDWSACAGQQIGRLSSHSFGFDVNRSKDILVYNFTLRLAATWWATSALGVRLGLGVAVPLAQDEFFGTMADGSTIRLLSRPILVPLADLGVGVRF
jgi:hypothetical protein